MALLLVMVAGLLMKGESLFVFAGGTPFPSQATALVWYRHKTSWYGAVRTCWQGNQQLLTLKTREKFTEVNRSLHSLHITEDYWFGLFHASKAENLQFLWVDCTQLEEFKNWKPPAEPNNLDTDHCIRIDHRKSDWKTKNCRDSFPFVCEKYGGDCTFEPITKKGIFSKPNRTFSVNDESACKRRCLTDSQNEMECWAFEYHNEMCQIFFDFTRNDLKMDLSSSPSSKTLHLKNCVTVSEDTSSAASVANGDSSDINKFINCTNSKLETSTASLKVTSTQEASTLELSLSTRSSSVGHQTTLDATLKTSQGATRTTSSPLQGDKPGSTALDAVSPPTEPNTSESMREAGTTMSSPAAALLCPCSCTVKYYNNASEEAKENKTKDEILKKIEKELKLDKKNLTSFKRKYISAPDERLSARAMGFVASTFLIITFSSIILMDFPRFIAFLHQIYQSYLKAKQ